MLSIDEFGQDRIAVSGDTYFFRDILKALPGRKWEPEEKKWSFPRTAHSYRLLTTLFPEAVVRSTLVDLSAKVWLLDEAMRSKTSKTLEMPGSKTRSWLHQTQSFWFAENRLAAQGGAMLALDMGTGKSKVAIDLVNHFQCQRILITCPVSVMDVWPDEFERHSEMAAAVHVCDRKHSVARRVREASDFLVVRDLPDHIKVVVINHEAIWRAPFGKWALEEDFDMIILDESHRAKSAGGKLSRYLGRWPSQSHQTYRLALTGTPCPHSIDDMYGQARFIDPSVHGTNHQVYKAQYMMMGGYGNYQVVGFKNTDDWWEKFHSMAIQVKADDVLDLPEAVHTNRYCTLEGEELDAYKDMKDLLVAKVKDGTITASNALVKYMRLAQIVQGVTTDTMGNEIVLGDSKCNLLIDTLKDIDKNEPVVVFCRFRCDLRSIGAAARACGRQCFELSGDANELAAWKEAAEYGPVIAVQLQAGGVGISMVQAKYCIYMSKDFSLGNYEQSLARVHRPGQDRNVTYIHLVAKGTIDETINKALAQRKDVVEAILAGAHREED
jgi:SNF2 family DNA or RNA helicase